MANFSGTSALTSRKYVFEPGVIIQNLSEKRFGRTHLFWLDSSVSALENKL